MLLWGVESVWLWRDLATGASHEGTVTRFVMYACEHLQHLGLFLMP